jgi:hypothetical protein
MGRPLNKKLFGNRNIGTTGTTDNRIGGEGVASVNITAEGTYTSALPTATFSTPEIPGGVRATGVVHGHALSAVVNAAGTGYNLNDTVLQNPSAGNEGIYATWRVSAVTVTGITLNNGGTAVDTGDEYTFSVAGFATPLRVRVTASNAGVATAVTIVNGGVWTNGALPSNTTGMTRAQVAAGQDFNGTGLQVNITTWGVQAVTVLEQGDYTALTGGAKSTSSDAGTGATLTITYGVSGVEVTQKGSGYVSPTDAAVTFSAGAAAGTSVLTTDGGAVSSSTNQENAIVAKAQLAGGADSTVDIISQKGARRFKVTDGTRTGVCKLVATSNLADGEMSVTATDARGNTYFVTKLTAKKATLTRNAQNGSNAWVHVDGGVAQWGFAAAAGSVVQVANA